MDPNRATSVASLRTISRRRSSTRLRLRLRSKCSSWPMFARSTASHLRDCSLPETSRSLSGRVCLPEAALSQQQILTPCPADLHLDSASVVALFSQSGKFDQAFSTGRVLDVDLTSVFESLAERCVTLALNADVCVHGRRTSSAQLNRLTLRLDAARRMSPGSRIRKRRQRGKARCRPRRGDCSSGISSGMTTPSLSGTAWWRLSKLLRPTGAASRPPS